MPKRLTQAEVDFRYSTAGVAPLDPYINGHTPTSSRCLKCGYIWKPRLDHLHDGHGCPQCTGYLRLTQEEVKKRFLEQGLELVGVYIQSHADVEAKCLKCLRVFSVKPTNVFHGDMGCGKCKLIEIVDARTGVGRRFTQSEVSDKFSECRLELLGTYVNSITPVEAQCMDCLHVYYPIPSVVISPSRHSGCPRCGHETMGEKRRLLESEVDSRCKFLQVVFLEPYIGNNKSILVLHLECGHKHKRFPADVFAGRGCWRCTRFGFQFGNPATLYYIRITNPYGNPVYKIGVTNRTVKGRFGKQMRFITILQLRFFQTGSEAYAEEQDLLIKYSSSRYIGPAILTDGTGTEEMFSEDILGLDTKEAEVSPLLL